VGRHGYRAGRSCGPGMAHLAVMSLAARAASGCRVKVWLLADRSWDQQAGAAAPGAAQHQAERWLGLGRNLWWP
jgi:hypothetical protein